MCKIYETPCGNFKEGEIVEVSIGETFRFVTRGKFAFYNPHSEFGYIIEDLYDGFLHDFCYCRHIEN